MSNNFFNGRMAIGAVLFVFICFLLVETAYVYSQDKHSRALPNVVIITLAGVRNRDTINNTTHQYIPHLWNDIFKEGTLYTNLGTLDITFHMPAIRDAITGKIRYVYPQRLKVPTIFQYVGNKYSLSTNKLWMIGAWSRGDCKDSSEIKYPSYLSTDFNMSGNCRDILSDQEKIFVKKYKDLRRKSLGWPIWSSLCEIEHRIFMRILNKFKPKLIYYAMEHPETGHYGVFSSYVLSIKTADDRIFDIWQIIKDDPYYKNNTYLIISVDHSRDEHYREHFQPQENVWLYIYGPNVEKGKVIKRLVHHADIFATVAYIMNIDISPQRGRVLRDCFVKLK